MYRSLQQEFQSDKVAKLKSDQIDLPKGSPEPRKRKEEETVVFRKETKKSAAETAKGTIDATEPKEEALPAAETKESKKSNPKQRNLKNRIAKQQRKYRLPLLYRIRLPRKKQKIREQMPRRNLLISKSRRLRSKRLLYWIKLIFPRSILPQDRRKPLKRKKRKPRKRPLRKRQNQRLPPNRLRQPLPPKRRRPLPRRKQKSPLLQSNRLRKHRATGCGSSCDAPGRNK